MTTPDSGPARRGGEIRSTELLKLLLDLFVRVDNKMQLLLAGNLAMLGSIGNTVARLRAWDNTVIAAVLATVLLSLSFFQLYRAALPKFMGTETRSLLYFRTIAARSEAEYVNELTAAGDDDIERDLAQQIWRNAVILSDKFTRVDTAFRYTAMAVAPWVVWLAIRPVTGR